MLCFDDVNNPEVYLLDQLKPDPLENGLCGMRNGCDAYFIGGNKVSRVLVDSNSDGDILGHVLVGAEHLLLMICRRHVLWRHEMLGMVRLSLPVLRVRSEEHTS